MRVVEEAEGGGVSLVVDDDAPAVASRAMVLRLGCRYPCSRARRSSLCWVLSLCESCTADALLYDRSLIERANAGSKKRRARDPSKGPPIVKTLAEDGWRNSTADLAGYLTSKVPSVPWLGIRWADGNQPSLASLYAAHNVPSGSLKRDRISYFVQHWVALLLDAGSAVRRRHAGRLAPEMHGARRVAWPVVLERANRDEPFRAVLLSIYALSKDRDTLGRNLKEFMVDAMPDVFVDGHAEPVQVFDRIAGARSPR